MSRLYKFFVLSRADQMLLIRTAFWLNAIRIGLWLLPYRILLRVLAKTWQAGDDQQRAYQGSAENINKVVWAVAVAKRYMPGIIPCLAEALVIRLLLRQRCYTAFLRIGVARGADGQLEAHAWVENESQVVIGGSGLGRYTPLEPLKGKRG